MSLGSGGPHTPFSLFPFRPPPFSPFNLPQTNVEKLLGLSTPVQPPAKMSGVPFIRDKYVMWEILNVQT